MPSDAPESKAELDARFTELYRRHLRDVYTYSYYRIGNLFSRLIGNPTIMGLATRHGLPRRTLMEFLLKLLANLYDPKDGATSDRVITAMARLAPSV